MQFKAIVFDIGGVLMHDVWEHVYFDDDGIAARYGGDRAALQEIGVTLWEEFAYAEHREEEYWSRFLEVARRVLSTTPTVSDLMELSWRYIRPVALDQAVTLLSELKEQGVVLGICSNNNSFWFAAQSKVFPFQNFFAPERIILSSQIGEAKTHPSGKMFQAVLASTGVPASKTLFVDDRQSSLDAAALFGIQTHLFPSSDPKGYAALRSKLVS